MAERPTEITIARTTRTGKNDGAGEINATGNTGQRTAKCSALPALPYE